MGRQYSSSGSSLILNSSDNSGYSWKTSIITSVQDISITTLIIEPNNDSTVFLGGIQRNGSGDFECVILKTTDTGSTWESLDLTGINSRDEGSIKSLAIDPFNPDCIYMITMTGLFQSFDGGRTWEKIISAEINSFCLKPDQPHRLFYAAPSGIYYSQDRGKNWIRIDEYSALAPVKYLETSSNSPFLFAGSAGESIYRLDLRLLDKPKKPFFLKAAVRSKNNIFLKWKDKSKNEQGFIIERMNHGKWVQIAEVIPNKRTYLDSNLDYKTKYKYRVKAFNPLGQSPPSNKAAAKTKRK